MKVGDIVRQSDKILKMKGRTPSKRLGIVIDIREQESPKGWETEKLKSLMNMIGRQVDVLWESGKLSKNFAENSLEIVDETHSER